MSADQITEERWHEFSEGTDWGKWWVLFTEFQIKTDQPIVPDEGWHKEARRAVERWADEEPARWMALGDYLASKGYGLDTGRWDRSPDADDYDSWYIWGEGEAHGNSAWALSLYHDHRGDWQVEGSIDGPIGVTAEDMEAAARIIRWHEERDRG